MSRKKIKPKNQTCVYGCGSSNVIWARWSKQWVCGPSKNCPTYRNYINNKFFAKHGVLNPSQIPGVQEKKIITCLKNHGVEYPSQNTKVLTKRVETYIKNYGCENPFQSPEIKEQIKQTNLEKFGVENPSQNKDIQQKKVQTCLKNYGVEFPQQSQQIKDQFKHTNLEKYGYEYPAQNSEIFNKTLMSLYKSKDYKFPSGKIIKVQGYEPQILDWLLQQNVQEQDIKAGSELSICIRYTFRNKQKIHHPDIYIEKINWLIDVKSSYTYTRDLEKNNAKMIAAINQGYNYNFVIYCPKSNSISIK